MDKILHFYAHFDCLLKVENEDIFIKKEEICCYSFSRDYVTLFIFSFCDKNCCNVAVDFSTPQIFCQNADVKLVDYQEGDYLLEISSIASATPPPYSLNFKKISFGGNTHDVVYSSHDTFLLCLKSNFDKLVLLNNNFVGTTTFRAIKNHLIFYSKTEQSRYILGQIDYENKKYVKKIFQEVDYLKDCQSEIVAVKKLADFGHHAIKYTFDIKNFTTKQQLSAENSPQIATKQELIPYAFVDAIKAKNFDLARKYLSKELSQKLDDAHLASFFGDFVGTFQDIKKDANLNTIALFYPKNQILQAKFFCFEFEENKISNIYEE